MSRYEIQNQIDDASNTFSYRMESTNVTLVGQTIYGDAEFDWSNQQRHCLVMHSLPDSARVVMHDVVVQGFGDAEDANNNYFAISNCYYIAGSDHLQPLSIEAVSTPKDPTKFWHIFSGSAPKRNRVIGYNSQNYIPNIYKAPYVYSCMQYQYLSLKERKQLDALNTQHSALNKLVFIIEGKNSLPGRPLLFTSNIEYYI